MWVIDKTETDSATGTTRRTIRRVAAGVSGILAVLYAVLLYIVYQQEAPGFAAHPDIIYEQDVPAGATQGSTYGAYIFLGLAYLIGALALALSERQAVLVVGIAVQVAVVVLYLMFGTAAAVSMWWGVVTVALEIALLGLLAYLLATAPRRPVSGLTDSRSGAT